MNARRARLFLARYGLLVALVLIGGVISWLAPQFLTWRNGIIVARQISINAILAIGVTYVLLTGGVDLSLGSVAALAGVCAACLGHPDQFPVFVPLLAGVLTGSACGALNGLAIAWGKVAPFIATLGMMAVARGLALVVSGGKPVSNLSSSFAYLGGGDVLGLPTPVGLVVVLAVFSHVILRHTRPGRYLYAVGDNESAAYAAGINVRSAKLFAYVVCGSLAGLGGVVLASRVTTGQPNAAIAYELDAIAAVVIGGTSLSGGVGGVGGTLLGALLMGMINNGLDLLNVSAYYQQIVKGLIIVTAVWLDRNPAR